MSDIVLREATDADIPAALAVLHAAFEEYRGWLDPPSGVHRETVESLRSYLERGHLTLAYSGDVLAGAVLYHAEPSMSTSVGCRCCQNTASAASRAT